MLPLYLKVKKSRKTVLLVSGPSQPKAPRTVEAGSCAPHVPEIRQHSGSQELHRTSLCVAGVQAFGPSSAVFPGEVAESWITREAAGTWCSYEMPAL